MISRIVLIVVIAVIGAGCEGATAGERSVVAAFYPLAYAAERVGGPDVSVHDLTPPGAEPHDFELAPKDVGELVEADVVLYFGHGFQPAVSRAVEDAHGKAVDLLAGLPLHGGDPHVWLDPELYGRLVMEIGFALGAPQRTVELRRELHQLHRDFNRELWQCRTRTIVTSHAAFGYLARRYRLRQVAITGFEPEAEPSARDLARVIAAVRRTKATTVFAETIVSPRLADTVAREVGARTAVLDPVETVKGGDTYFTVMRRNLAALRQGLGCR